MDERRLIDSWGEHIDPWANYLCHGCVQPVEPADPGTVWLGVGSRRAASAADAESFHLSGPYFAHPHCWPFPKSETGWRRVRPPAVVRRERS